jgi:hypothetical protein
MRAGMTRLAPLLLLPLAACVAQPIAPVVRAATPPPAPYASVGLERVIGQDAAGLTALFGEADADYREGTARKLQFESRFCVLDAYLYPKGSAAPRVTHLDARQPDGSPIDRASCVAALVRRREAR